MNLDLKKLFGVFERQYVDGISTAKSLSEHIACKHEDVQKIIISLQVCRTRLKKLEDIYKQETEQMNQNIRSIQFSCNHELTTYYPDPSGNNDSHTECDICGLEITKKMLKAKNEAERQKLQECHDKVAKESSL